MKDCLDEGWIAAMKIDVCSHGNVPRFRDLEWFAGIPVGEMVLAGVAFELCDSIVLTHGYVEDGKSRFRPGLPEEVRIGMGAEARYLAFAHTALFQRNAFRWSNAEAIAAEYRIQYDDGTTERLPVTVGANTRNWGSDASCSLRYERPAWVAGAQGALSICCWENPHPEKSIRAIDVVSVEDTTTSVALFAISALDDRPWDSGIFRHAREIQVAARQDRITAWRQQARTEIGLILAEKDMVPDALAELSFAAVIRGRELHWGQGRLDLELNRTGTVSLTRHEGGGYQVEADLMNEPGLGARLNQREYALDRVSAIHAVRWDR
jgi:hypothetical protein